MTAYLGPVGGLVPLLGMQAPQVTHLRETSGRVTLGGRLKTQRAVRSRREWTVSTHGLMSPAGVASLLALEAGGTPPWVWAEPYAQVTNLFTPEQSVLLPGTWDGTGFVEAGSVTVGGLVLPRSVAATSANTIRFGYTDGLKASPPVLPGVRCYASAYVRGTGNLVLTYQDYSGAAVGSVTVAYNNPVLARVSVTGIPPAGTATIQFNAGGALQAAGPALTWTPALADWSIGRGCNRAVVDGLSEAVQLAVAAEPYMRRSGISFTVREVG